MGVLAWILGILGILCAAMGIVTAAELIPLTGTLLTAFTPESWLMLAIVIMLAAIAATLGKSRREEE